MRTDLAYKLIYIEKMCLAYVMRGRSAREIGKILNISNKTVESYIASAKKKWECKTRAELFDKAYEEDNFVEFVKSVDIRREIVN